MQLNSHLNRNIIYMELKCDRAPKSHTLSWLSCWNNYLPSSIELFGFNQFFDRLSTWEWQMTSSPHNFDTYRPSIANWNWHLFITSIPFLRYHFPELWKVNLARRLRNKQSHGTDSSTQQQRAMIANKRRCVYLWHGWFEHIPQQESPLAFSACKYE